MSYAILHRDETLPLIRAEDPVAFRIHGISAGIHLVCVVFEDDVYEIGNKCGFRKALSKWGGTDSISTK
jgi:hypothetical protein